MTDGNDVSREHLAELLNEDLAREYQAIIGYVVYSQVLSGAQYMDIAAPTRKRGSPCGYIRRIIFHKFIRCAAL
jgi:hypothetical protein